MDLYRVLRPLLFALPPDVAHDLSLRMFRGSFWHAFDLGPPARPELMTRLGEMELENPFGLAAGFDKDGDITASVASLGFGFLVVGSVRPLAHPGNPRPWFVRRLREDGIVNSMGLPSKGAAYVKSRLQGQRVDIPVMVSLVGESPEDFVQVYKKLEGLASGWEVNLSCPNTATGRTLEEDLEAFSNLLRSLPLLKGPFFLKLSPYNDEDGRERAMELAKVAIRHGFRGFTLCNTLPVRERGLGTGRGGLSGRPLHPLALRAVRDFREEWGHRIDIIGVGGILTGQQALEMLQAGAQAVEVLTALILRGPLVVRHLAEELRDAMRAEGLASVEEAVGRKA